MAVRVPNVPGQPPQAQAQRPRRQIRHPAGGKNREAGVVRDQMQPRELPLPRPADPRVPNPHLERARLPAQQRQPRLAPNRHVPQRLAEQPAEGQVVVLAHQRVPAPPLIHAAHRANLHLAQPAHSAPPVRHVHGDVLSQRLLNGQRKPTEDVGYAPSGLLNSPAPLLAPKSANLRPRVRSYLHSTSMLLDTIHVPIPCPLASPVEAMLPQR